MAVDQARGGEQPGRVDGLSVGRALTFGKNRLNEASSDDDVVQLPIVLGIRSQEGFTSAKDDRLVHVVELWCDGMMNFRHACVKRNYHSQYMREIHVRGDL